MCQKFEYLNFEKEKNITFSSWKAAGIAHQRGLCWGNTKT